MRFPADVPTLTSGDVTLRAHSVDDVDAIVEQCVDPVSVQWTTVPLGYTREMALEFVGTSVPQMWETGKEHIFAIECTHPDGRRRFGGSLSLRDEGGRRAELAFGAHPEVRGRGVMTTAVNLLLDWGFSDRHLETVSWLANAGNFGSRRVAWKTGFTFGGTVRRWLDHRGEFPDAWIGALHKDDQRLPTTRWYDAPRIVGTSVVLRAIRDDDGPRIVAGCADPRSQEWLPVLPSPYTLADAEGYLARVRLNMAEGTQVQWAVADPDSDELLGNVGIPRLDQGNGEIGYWTHPAARGRGLMREAVSLVVRHGFLPEDAGGLGMHRLHIKAADGNPASQYVATASGFQPYGRERSSAPHRGVNRDMHLFDLLRDEWEARQS